MTEPLIVCLAVCAGQNDCVDHVDHAVCCFDVSADNCCFFNHDAVVQIDGDRLTLYSCCFHVVGQICRHHFAWHNVVRQDCNQLVLVFGQQQGLNCAFWQSSERFVSWGEDCERTVAFQCVNEAGGLDSCHECFERTCVYGGVNDVLFSGGRRKKWRRSPARLQKQEEWCGSFDVSQKI